jgi:phage terminase large subunit GpA-like protein
MTSIYVPCPRCGEEIEVDMKFRPGEWDTNTPETWEAEDFTRSCDCALTPAEDDAVAAQAVKDATNDPEFGVYYPEPTYGNEML